MSSDSNPETFIVTRTDGIEIELVLVAKWSDKIHVVFSDGDRSWLVDDQYMPMPVQDFQTFRRHILDRVKLLITHESQKLPTEQQRQKAWSAAIRLAGERFVQK